jgi:hypothetical protein
MGIPRENSHTRVDAMGKESDYVIVERDVIMRQRKPGEFIVYRDYEEHFSGRKLAVIFVIALIFFWMAWK